METALAIMIGSFILSVISFVLFLYFFFFRYRKDFRGITQLSTILDARLRDEDSAEMLNDALDSFYHLGAAAQNVNAILTDEEAFDGILTELASRVRKSIMGSIMGTASGDIKKKAHAERVLNEAIIDGAQKMNPVLGLFLKITGLDEELRKDPEMTGYILQLLSEKGLMNMIDSNILSLPSGQQEAAVRSAAQQIGIDF